MLIISCSDNQNLNDWIGKYYYEEQPETALADYSMVMSWSIEIEKVEREYLATIEVNGQQTYMIIKAIVKGTENNVSLIFEKGIDGFGYDNLKRGDNLLVLKKVDNQIMTIWEKLTPRLKEEFVNECTCFQRLE